MVDQILARATQLPNDQLYALHASIGKELEMRKDAEQAGDWKNLQEALATYIRKWGTIIIEDDSSNETIYLALGGYTAASFGEIEIGG
jgi:hypothetical protein